MSDNLSIDEIIKRAEKIREEAERHLRAAEKSIDEKAKAVIDDVIVDEEKVVERISKIHQSIEEDEDVKEYIPHKKAKQRQVFKTREFSRVPEDEEDDVKIAPDISDDKIKVFKEPKAGKTSVVPDIKRGKRKNSDSDNCKTRPVTIMSKPKKNAQSGLEGVPIIVAKEQIFEDEKEEHFEEEIGVQITFDGFDDAIESVPTIDEDVAEQILEQCRQEKVGKFRLFGPDETDKDLGIGIENVVNEYENIDDRYSFIDGILSKKKVLKIRAVITGVLTALLLALSVFKDSAYFPAFLSGHMEYFAFAIVLYAIVLVVNFNVFIHGFNIKKGLNFDFSISLLSVMIIGHTVSLMLSDSLWIDNGVLLVSAGSFALLLSQLGKHSMMSSIVNNYSFIDNGRDNYTIENIANAVDAQIISRGVIEKEPLIKTSVKTDIPTNFLEISCKTEPADKITNILSAVMFALSAVLFVIIGIIDNFNSAFNIAMYALCVSVPVSALLLSNSVLKDISRALKKFGARICGYEGALMADDANAMVMEAADFFSKDSCELHGIKTFNGAKVDDAIIQTAAVIIQTKSPLAHVFDDVIIGKQSILPKVDNVVYEDKLGTSAWIYNQKVLVGNRDLLLHHGVDVPMTEFEQKFTIKGRKALYLAVGGVIHAMFVVSYNADLKLRRELKKLEKSGISIILRSCDPYINEDSINEMFSLPQGYIHIMNYSATRVYEKYSDMTVEKSPAYALHNGSALGFVSAMRGAEITVGLKHVLSFLIAFGSALGFMTVALLSVLGTYTELSAANIIAFQVIWTAFAAIVSKIRISFL